MEANFAVLAKDHPKFRNTETTFEKPKKKLKNTTAGILIFCELGAHANLQNPTTTPSMILGMG